MDLLILRPLCPKTGHHLFEGGAGGGQKFWLRRLQSMGSLMMVTSNRGPMVTHQAAAFQGGGSNLGRRRLPSAPPPYLPHKGLNRRPKHLRQPALPFGHCPS